MEEAKQSNVEEENYRFSRSGCLIASVGFLICITMILSGLGFFNPVGQTISKWYINMTDPAPEGREALIWRYFKGLETGEYEHWETGYDAEGNAHKYREILWDMEETCDMEELRDSHRYYEHKYGDDFSITYEVDDVEPMDDEQLIRFSDYFKEKYEFTSFTDTTVTIYDEYGDGLCYYVVTHKAWVYELYIKIEGEDDDTAYKSNYVIYELDGRLYLEPMNFK